jgi:hypothetical protein
MTHESQPTSPVHNREFFRNLSVADLDAERRHSANAASAS